MDTRLGRWPTARLAAGQAVLDEMGLCHSWRASPAKQPLKYRSDRSTCAVRPVDAGGVGLECRAPHA
jgi:hypothetical protein